MAYKEADFREAVKHLRQRENLLKQTAKACNDAMELESYCKGAIGRMEILIPKLEKELTEARARLPKLKQDLASTAPSLATNRQLFEKQKKQVDLAKKRIKLLEQLKEVERDKRKGETNV